MYTPQPRDTSSAKRRDNLCIMQGVSACYDFVHPRICNRHALIFGLKYAVVRYINGNNERWSEIATYICTPTLFALPLFSTADGVILQNEVYVFCTNAKSDFPDIDFLQMKHRIYDYLGVNDREKQCKVRGWLDDKLTQILVKHENGTESAWRSLPELHKILLYYTRPSTSATTTRTVWRPPILGIEQSNTAMEQQTPLYRFVMCAPEITLKWDDREGCVATPIVLSARYEAAEENQTLVTQRISMIRDNLEFCV